jgi:hypothetical protein
LARRLHFSVRDLRIQAPHGGREQVSLAPRAGIVGGRSGPLGVRLASQLAALTCANMLSAVPPLAYELSETGEIFVGPTFQ